MDLFLLSKLIRPFLTFSNLFVFFIIILFFIRNKNYYLKFFFKIFIIFYLIIGIFPIAGVSGYYFLKKEFINKENNLDFDSILVLAGSESRYLRAINLHKKKPDSKIIFSGGSGLLISKNRSEEINDFNYLTSNLISEDKLIILESSANTIQNLKNFKKANNNYKFNKTILITSISHYKRSLIISKKLDLNLTPYYYNAEKTSFSFLNFFQNYSFSSNWSQFDRLILELFGILRVLILRL